MAPFSDDALNKENHWHYCNKTAYIGSKTIYIKSTTPHRILI